MHGQTHVWSGTGIIPELSRVVVPLLGISRVVTVCVETIKVVALSKREEEEQEALYRMTESEGRKFSGGGAKDAEEGW